ncbi:hypothetical protein MP228_001793 [Amoeboaphelidium protococcarum]|nr:hypothetical protein MP228_001793 [Amoeboaphelidium protococcarum]
MTKRKVDNIYDYERAWACSTYYDLLKKFMSQLSVLQWDSIKWYKELMVEFHDHLRRLAAEDVQVMAFQTLKRLKTKCTLDTSSCRVSIEDIKSHGSGLFRNYLQDVCERQDKMDYFRRWTSFVAVEKDGVHLVAQCSERLHPGCSAKFKVYRSGNVFGLQTLNQEEFCTVSVPKITIAVGNQVVCDLDNLKQEVCLGLQNLKVPGHYLASLPCAFDAKKVVKDAAGVESFNAECFGVYTRDRGNGARSHPNPRCRSCIKAGYRTSGVSSIGRGDLQLSLEGRCEITGCSNESLIGGITCANHVRQASSGRNKASSIPDSLKSEEERQLQSFKGTPRQILACILPNLVKFAGRQFNVAQCANVKIGLSLPYLKRAQVDLLVPSPLGVLCLEIDQNYHNASSSFLTAQNYRMVRRYDEDVEQSRMLAVSSALQQQCQQKSAWLRIGFGRSVTEQTLAVFREQIDRVLEDIIQHLRGEDPRILAIILSANPSARTVETKHYDIANLEAYIKVVNDKSNNK